MMEEIIIGAVFVVAVIFIVRRYVNMSRGKGGCGSCNSCSGASKDKKGGGCS